MVTSKLQEVMISDTAASLSVQKAVEHKYAETFGLTKAGNRTLKAVRFRKRVESQF
jgi:hypothetical protein